MKIDGSYITVLLRVHGLVQGVGFRYWTKARAGELALGGYVKNLPDKSVEALLSGSMDAVGKMVELMGFGPGHSIVDELEIVKRTKTDEPVQGFRILN